VELGNSALTRRERLERIAMAERDRRAGRIAVAVAAIGEPSEWPARVVLALARLPEFEGAETRQFLEEGLDLWAMEVGLAPFGEPSSQTESSLDRPIEHSELERAFAEAEAQTDEMHDANRVAERILMDEPVGLAELDGDMIPPLEQYDVMSTDACAVEEVQPVRASDPVGETSHLQPSQAQIRAKLAGWLQNLEGSNARSAQ
jgi:hypothetical protein